MRDKERNLIRTLFVITVLLLGIAIGILTWTVKENVQLCNEYISKLFPEQNKTQYYINETTLKQSFPLQDSRIPSDQKHSP